MAIKPQLGDGRIFQEFAGFSEDKPNIFTKMKLDGMAVNGLGDLMPDTIDMPFGVKFPLRSRSEYEVSFTMQADPGIFDKIDSLITEDMRRRAKLDKLAIMHPDFAAFFRKLWTDRYCHSSGEISGKGVRRMMADIRHNTIRGHNTRRGVIAELIAVNVGLMNPNKIARLIRRNFARAAAKPTRPLIAITPDFSELRNADGKELDAVFRGQDES